LSVLKRILNNKIFLKTVVKNINFFMVASLDFEDYNESYRYKWDEFVENSANGTIFHLRKFLSYHPPDRFNDSSIVIKKNDQIFALFPAVSVDYMGKRALFSHRGASYGGFVYNATLSISSAFSMVRRLVDYAYEKGFEKIVITIPPIIYSKRPSQYIDFSLLKNGFKYLKKELSSILFLEESIEENVKKFKQVNRTAFRKAIKLGVEVRESEDWEVFYDILKNNLKIRHNVKPTHSLEELLKLKNIFPDRIRLYGAYLRDEMIAGVVMFDCNSQVSLAFYISHREDMQQYRGVNLLFYYIIEDSIKRGFKYLDFGIFTVNMEPNFGLGRFKEGFGATGIFRDTFYIDLK